jgi:hypothetical protein
MSKNADSLEAAKQLAGEGVQRAALTAHGLRGKSHKL